MGGTVIGTIEITEALIPIVRRIVGMRGTVIATEGTAEAGEIAGARPQPTGVGEDTRLSIDAEAIRLSIGTEEATQGAHRGEEALAATGSRTVRVVQASPLQVVQIHVGEAGEIAGDENRHWFDILKRSPFMQRLSKCMPHHKTDNSTAMSSLLCFL